MVARRAGAPLHILVTRPAGEAADLLCETLTAAGYKAFSQPLLELMATPPPDAAQRRILQALDGYQHVIFISGNAVRYGMALIDDCWPQLPVGLSWYAVGAATAAGLERFGITVVTPVNTMSSEGLLALPPLQTVREQRVLIVKGAGGRDTLRQELVRRGALVDELACYRRSLPQLPAGELAARIARWKIDLMLISSGEGLANLQLLLSPAESTKLKATGMVVPSERVAQLALQAGFEHVATAENASDAAMLHALRRWVSGAGE